MKEKEIEKHLVQLQKVLHRYARSLTCDRDNAWDLLQETNLKTLEQREKFKEGTDFRAWALTVMHNLFINRWKKSARMFFAPDMEEIKRSMAVEPGYDPAERYEIREQVAYGSGCCQKKTEKYGKCGGTVIIMRR